LVVVCSKKKATTHPFVHEQPPSHRMTSFHSLACAMSATKQLKNRKAQEAVDAVLKTLAEGTAEEKETACRQISSVLRVDSDPTGSVAAAADGGADITAADLVEVYGKRVVPLLVSIVCTPLPSDTTEMVDGGGARAAAFPEELGMRLLMSAAAALRNLCIAGGVLICKEAVGTGSTVDRVIAALRQLLTAPDAVAAHADPEETDGDDDDERPLLIV
jgi:hypothetical protein